MIKQVLTKTNIVLTLKVHQLEAQEEHQVVP